MDIKPLVAELQTRLAGEEEAVAAAMAAVVKTKTGINVLCELAGEQPLYPDVSLAAMAASKSTASATLTTMAAPVRPDQFYGKPLATVVREVLETRKKYNLGPAAIQDIYTVMKSGGFAFESKDEDNAMRGMAVSISKNTALFARLPNGLIGLTEWYGPARRRKATTTRENSDNDSASPDMSDDDSPADGTDQQEVSL